MPILAAARRAPVVEAKPDQWSSISEVMPVEIWGSDN